MQNSLLDFADKLSVMTCNTLGLVQIYHGEVVLNICHVMGQFFSFGVNTDKLTDFACVASFDKSLLNFIASDTHKTKPRNKLYCLVVGNRTSDTFLYFYVLQAMFFVEIKMPGSIFFNRKLETEPWSLLKAYCQGRNLQSDPEFLPFMSVFTAKWD